MDKILYKKDMTQQDKDNFIEKYGIGNMLQEDDEKYWFIPVPDTSKEQEISSLKMQLRGMDYKQFKYLRGEYTEEQWAVIKAEIQSITAQIKELEGV